jgi:hypothetical protein
LRFPSKSREERRSILILVQNTHSPKQSQFVRWILPEPQVHQRRLYVLVTGVRNDHARQSRFPDLTRAQDHDRRKLTRQLL